MSAHKNVASSSFCVNTSCIFVNISYVYKNTIYVFINISCIYRLSWQNTFFIPAFMIICRDTFLKTSVWK